MNLYAILRRDGFTDGPTLEAAAARSTKIGDEDMPDDIRWIRSYVLGEESGTLGTVCIYQASSEEAIRKHAAAADLPISEIVPSVPLDPTKVTRFALQNAASVSGLLLTTEAMVAEAPKEDAPAMPDMSGMGGMGGMM